jgi:hypothetical protein
MEIVKGLIATYILFLPFFEKIYSYMFSAANQMLDSVPGTLMLSDCLDLCQNNDTCSSVNYETGLCILFTSNADKMPGEFFQRRKIENVFEST